MIEVTKQQFNGTTEELQARVAAFTAAKVAHTATKGVPAPLEDDVVMHLAAAGQEFAVVELVEPTPVPLSLEFRLKADISVIEYTQAGMRRMREILIKLLPDGEDKDDLIAAEAAIEVKRQELAKLEAQS